MCLCRCCFVRQLWYNNTTKINNNWGPLINCGQKRTRQGKLHTFRRSGLRGTTDVSSCMKMNLFGQFSLLLYKRKEFGVYIIMCIPCNTTFHMYILPFFLLRVLGPVALSMYNSHSKCHSMGTIANVLPNPQHYLAYILLLCKKFNWLHFKSCIL